MPSPPERRRTQSACPVFLACQKSKEAWIITLLALRYTGTYYRSPSLKPIFFFVFSYKIFFLILPQMLKARTPGLRDD